MSTFKVPLTEIRAMHAHPNAERLEIAEVYAWYVVVQKNRYKPGDKVVYVPVDSILSPELEAKLFPEGSKIKLSKSRVKSIKIRGNISQGMLIDPREFALDNLPLETDCASFLGVTKYESPVNEMPRHMFVKTSKKVQNANFSKYSDIENLKYYDRIIQDNEMVTISEKLHGSSARFNWVFNEPNTLWKKFLRLIGLLPKWEFCWGSRNVQIQNKPFHQGYYDIDVYTKIMNQYDLRNRIPKGFGLYGEIVGDGIQKNYTYGCGKNEHAFYVYDVRDTRDPDRKNHRWLDHAEMTEFCARHGFQTVPQLYVGPWSMQEALKHRDGDSTIGGQKVREGIVVKPVVERTSPTIGRVILKFISDNYYLNNEDGTEFH